MPRINVSMILTAEQVQDYYAGRVRYVVAWANDGRTVQMPISILHKYISNQGIRGNFTIITDENFKFQRIVSANADDGKGLDLMG